MDGLDRIASWVTENEAFLSGVAAMIAILAIVPALLRPLWRRRPAQAGGEARGARKDGGSAAKPRIAILPFATGPADPELQTEAEALQQEVTTLLARSAGCEVISTWAVNGYAMEGGGSAEAGRVLRVRYVVEGQLRPVAGGFRVTANLVDTEDSRVAWSDAFQTSEPGADLSSQLAERIASHLGIEIVRAEVGRAKQRQRSRMARDLMLRAQGILFSEGHRKQSYERAIRLLEQAASKEPGFGEAIGMTALLYALGECFGFFERSDAFRDKVFELCRRALDVDDRSSEVLGYVGCAYCDLRHYEQGLPLLERAVALNPSNAQARAALGTAFHGMRRFEESAAALEASLEISPAYKGIAPWATVLAGTYLALDRQQDAAAALERALRCDPNYFPAHLTGVLVALGAGDTTTARRHLDEAHRIEPELGAQAVATVVGATGAREIAKLEAVASGG